MRSPKAEQNKKLQQKKVGVLKVILERPYKILCAGNLEEFTCMMQCMEFIKKKIIFEFSF